MPRFRLRIVRPISEAILTHARACLPNEACGFLAGREGTATHHFPLVNALASPMGYEVDPRELLAVHRRMRETGLVEVAIYHSHPTSAPIPSARDLAQNGYGDSIPHLIIGPGDEVRAWWLTETEFAEAEWELTP